MNKTISINLSGLLFNLEENAYEMLSQYIAKIRNTFKNTEGSDEIVGDIERRIAELFQDKLKLRQVILVSDVKEVIEILGEPEAYSEAPEDEPEQSKADNNTENASSSPKRLFRVPDEGMYGGAGVCAGLGYYFNVDPVWFRLGFTCAIIFGGTGLLLYIILAIVLPKAETTADKLQMKGEPVTISSIEKNIREEMSRLQKKSGNLGQQARSSAKNAEGTLNEIFQAIGKFFSTIFKIIGKSLGVFMIILGGALLIAWLTVVFSGGQTTFSNDNSHGEFSFPTFAGIFFSNENHLQFFLIGLGMLTFAPILGLILGGTRLISPTGFLSPWPATINGSLFIIGLFMSVISAALGLSEYKNSGKIIEPVTFIPPAPKDTLMLALVPESAYNLKDFADLDEWKIYLNDEEPFLTGTVSVDVRKAENPAESRITVEKKARGKDKKTAIRTASEVITYLKQDGKTLYVNPHFRLKNQAQWRAQEAQFVIYLAEGMHLSFAQGTREIFGDIPNIQNLVGEELEREIFQMGPDGLSCVSCTASEN